MKILFFSFLLLMACGPKNQSDLTAFELRDGEVDTAYLVVGGGYNPYGAQIVLEKNLELFDSALDPMEIDSDRQVTRLFGGGNDESIMDILEEAELAEQELLFAGLFAKKCPDCKLRHNRLTNLDGKADKLFVESWLELAKSKLEANDKLRFYYTGHGAHEPDEYEHNFLALWRSELDVQEFTTHLDALPAETHTQVVMVQCFSGGFSQMNYVGGDVETKELSDANRCGFFSQVADRPASGCSADINAREEYSPYFFAAYMGVNEAGEPVNADFNRDGKITSEEAHAYVIMNEKAQDVPITTSSQLLRDLDLTVDPAFYLQTWSEISDEMTTSELSISEHLSSLLELNLDDGAILKLKGLIQTLVTNMDEAGKVADAQWEVKDSLTKQIKNDLMDRFPALENPFGLNQGQFGEQYQEAMAAMAKHPAFEQYKTAIKYEDELYDNWFMLKKRKVMAERLGYLLKTKYLEEKLKESELSRAKNRYYQLKECESKSFFE